MKLRISDWLWGLVFLLSAYDLLRTGDRWALELALGMAVSLATMLPMGFALWWLDRLPPLPARTWWRALGLGLLTIPVVASFAHVYVEVTVGDQAATSDLIDQETAGTFGDLAGSLLSAPILEETLKGLLPFYLLAASVDHLGLKQRRVGPWPALLVGLLVAFAFSCTENATHFARNPAEWQDRLLFPYLHGAFSLPMLLAIGFAVLLPSLSSRMALVLAGWSLSVALHAMWNTEIRFNHPDWSLWPWIRHMAVLSPFICTLAIGFVYAWEARSLRRLGGDPGSLKCPPRTVGDDSLAVARDEMLSRPFGNG